MQIFTADDGTLYTKTPTATLLTSRTVPAGCTAKGNVPSFAKFRRTTVIAGRYNRMVSYRDDLDIFYAIGITPPAVAPTLADGGGTGVIDGDIIGYYTFVQKAAGVVVMESAPSPASTTITVDKVATINWSAIATTAETRVTHVRLYRSDDGFTGRQVTEFAIGTSTYTDTGSFLSLGQELELDGGVPPYTLYCCTYKGRVYYAGDPDHPDYVWVSNVEDSENVDPENFFRTASGEAVTGLGTQGDSLLIFTANTVDQHREFATGDFAKRQISSSIGCINHRSIVQVHDRLWFASQHGIYVYDGSFRYVTAELKTFWKTEYAAHRSEYESCFAADDRPENCYILSIPFSDHTFRWVAYYLPFEPEVGGGDSQPWWYFDQRTRVDKALGLLTYGGIRFRLYVGSDDGYLRQEDVDSDPSDDSDAFNKALTIQTKLYLFDDPGGDSEEGKSLARLWSYVESENNAWTVKVYGGDESAADQLTHNWKDDVAASALTSGGHNYVAKTVHWHVPEQVVGRGFLFKYTATSPNQLYWRGFGGNWEQVGAAFRGQAT